MRKYWRIAAAWIVATALSIAIAAAAVAGIRDRVVETPVAIGLPTSTVTDAPPVTDSTVATTVTTAAPASTTSTSTAPITTEAPTTTLPPDTTDTTAAATTTTAPPVTTTTTAPPPNTTAPSEMEYFTWDLIGGTVLLSFGNGEVWVVSAVPRPGFSYDGEHTGPNEVEVEFVGNDHKSKLEAHIDNGELRVDTEEEAHGEDED